MIMLNIVGRDQGICATAFSFFNFDASTNETMCGKAICNVQSMLK